MVALRLDTGEGGRFAGIDHRSLLNQSHRHARELGIDPFPIDLHHELSNRDTALDTFDAESNVRTGDDGGSVQHHANRTKPPRTVVFRLHRSSC